MKKIISPILIFFSSLILALYNIAGFPKMVGDEGIYVSQAYWLSHLGRLGPYTYWYDHFPLGWAQIGLWQLLVGPMPFFNSSVLSARVFIGFILAGTATLLYLLVHKLSKSQLSGVIASILYVTSALTLTFGRMVLLDNIAIFWFLLSLLLLLSNSTKLKNLVLSALTLSFAILSKESLLFFLPPYLYLVAHLSKNSLHKKYALTINYLTIFFALTFFPLLAILKNELFPKTGQVSFLKAIIFQASRGTQLPFWDPSSHFSQTLAIWLKIDPILIILGGFATTILLLTKIDIVQKIIVSFTLFFFLFLARGGQIYDFYIIPVLPLLSYNVAILVHKLSENYHLKLIGYIFIISIVMNAVTNTNYIFTSKATSSQLDAIQTISKLPPQSSLIVPEYLYLDTYLKRTDLSINWYKKAEADVAIRNKINTPSYILLDEQFSRELLNDELPYLSKLMKLTVKTNSFGNPLSPGENNHAYEHDYLELYKPISEQQTKIIISIPVITQSTLEPFISQNIYGLLITNNNFTSSQDLQNNLKLIKRILPNILIFTTQDSEGQNTIPWITSSSRSLFKSNQEAKNSTIIKARALKEIGFDGAIIATSQDKDSYLNDIISASSPVFSTLIKYDGNNLTTQYNLLFNNENDLKKAQDSGYKGQLFLIKNLP